MSHGHAQDARPHRESATVDDLTDFANSLFEVTQTLPPQLASNLRHAVRDDPEELIPGGSGIIGTDGQWIAGPVVGREEAPRS